MSTDRRILKSQEAIKFALIEMLREKSLEKITMKDIAERANIGRRTIYLHYMDKFDLLEKLIEEHMNELRSICIEGADQSFEEGNILWFEYFKKNYQFFTALLANKGGSLFRVQFLNLVIDELRGEVNTTSGKNQGLSEEVVLNFFGAAIVGIVEWWFANEMPYSPEEAAKQVGILLDRNL